MKIYNKLVRDKIPEIIKNNGEVPNTYIADDKEYRERLKEKLIEEVNEFIEDESREEMADVLEVIKAICKHKEYDSEELELLRKNKETERGGFYDKIILENVAKDN